MVVVLDVISCLEKYPITKEALEVSLLSDYSFISIKFTCFLTSSNIIYSGNSSRKTDQWCKEEDKRWRPCQACQETAEELAEADWTWKRCGCCCSRLHQWKLSPLPRGGIPSRHFCVGKRRPGCQNQERCSQHILAQSREIKQPQAQDGKQRQWRAPARKNLQDVFVRRLCFAAAHQRDCRQSWWPGRAAAPPLSRQVSDRPPWQRQDQQNSCERRQAASQLPRSGQTT